MLKRFRAPSPAFVISLIALFVALGGTSLAAATLINGKNIKKHTIAKDRLTNKAVKQLKGNRGPRGPQGAQGLQGTQGIQGIQGIQGNVGARGPSDVYEVALDATSAQQTANTPLTLTLSNLPAGAYAIFGTAAIDATQTNSSSSRCILAAGTDSDTSYNPLRTDASWIKAISTQLTHTFTSTGSVTMTCTAFSDTWKLGGDGNAGTTRIVAIAAGTQHKTTAAAAAGHMTAIHGSGLATSH